MNNFFNVLTRKKVLDPIAVTQTQLARVLNTFDLTALGVGSTLGVGVYVLAGHVARDTAGPSVVLSFLIAAIASVFAGLCYAEFGARVPRAGSAYIYSYVTVGEIVAFIIGWNLILEYVIGSASVARGLSLYLDTLINNTLQDTFREIAPINVSFMSPYFDFFSFGLSVILAALLAFGMKESSLVNTIFTVLNILVVLFVIIAGSFKAEPKNWNLDAPSNTTYGTGGFFPYGISGTIKGAATCFYGFVGFDCIATTGEEVRNPQKAIPISIVVSLLIIFLAYFGTATVVTLMVPYYLQDINAPIPHAFAAVGWDVAKWIVAVGGIFGLCASLFGAMFPLPRVIYAMASDGLIFRFLGRVSPRFHTPLIGTVLAGLLTGLMSSVFDLKQLVNMMSIGTLLAYTIVAACVLLLRYGEDDCNGQYNLIRTSSESDQESPYTYNEGSGNIVNSDSSELIDSNGKVTFGGLVKQIFNYRKLQNPTKTTQTLVTIEICIYATLSLALGLCIMHLQDELRHARIWAIIIISVIGLFLILTLMSIATQPNSETDTTFKVPLVPLIPALSILINIYLMLMLDVNTWIRFGVWMAIGLPMYFISVSGIYPKMHAKVNTDFDKSNGHLKHNLTTEFTKNGSVNGKTEELTIKCSTHFITNLKPKAPSPPTTLNSSPDSLSVYGALAALDAVLSKEELTHAFQNYRKCSIDTESNISHVEESVIALVHNEDDNPNVTLSIIEEPPDTTDTPVESATDNVTDIPVPPPLPSTFEFELFVPRLPRLTLSKLRDDMYTEIKPPLVAFSRSKSVPDLYHNDLQVPDSPPPDYLPSRKVSIIQDIDDNVTFGSEQHVKVISKLNRLFENKHLGFPAPNKLTKPRVSQENVNTQKPVFVLPILPVLPNAEDHVDEIAEKKDSVVVEVMTPADIKKKLNEILKRDPRLTMRPIKSNYGTISDCVDEEQSFNGSVVVNKEMDVGDRQDDSELISPEIIGQMQHKNLMSNTFKSIKLRKIDSIKMD